MISTISNDACIEFRGLSSDTKPIGKPCSNANVDSKISNGSVFFEMDTKKVWMLKITSSTVGEVTTYTGTWIEI